MRDLTILIPTSPIPRHPDTSMLEECVDAVRFYLPEEPLVIMADGVRPSVEHRRQQYAEYIDRVHHLVVSGRFGQATVRVFEGPSQQAIMARETLRSVTTSLIAFIEHDAILRNAPLININDICQVLSSGEANVVRLYAWGQRIWPEHEFLMRGSFTCGSSNFVRTVQYSQWPLFSRTDYHRRILDQYFKPGQRAMIETVMYSPVLRNAWEEHRIVIYGPDESPTFSHRNGRLDETTGYRDPAEW